MLENNATTFKSTGETPLGFGHWIVSEKGKIISIVAHYHNLHDELGQSVVEFSLAMIDGSNLTHKIPLGEGKVQEAARTWVRELEELSGLTIPFEIAS
jgi:hypothetical protein